MGGEADDLNAELQRQYKESMELDDAIRQAVRILRRAAPAGSTVSRLEVAVLERNRPRRSFRRLTDDQVGKALESLGPGAAAGPGAGGKGPSSGTAPPNGGSPGSGSVPGVSGGDTTNGPDATGG
jgi:proteasome alpha subunit